MKRKIILAICSLFIVGSGIGMTSLPHEEQPVSQIMREEAALEKEPEEIIEELRVCEEGCTLEEGHEGNCEFEEEEDIEVILKTTSMERDLKVKFVDKKTGKLISGAAFRMKLTDSSKNSKEYSDHDNDGIIWVKDIDGGAYTVEMLDLEGYVTAKILSAEVKKKIEYKVVEIAEEVKSESEIVVSKEDAAYGGTNKDESTSSSAELKDTVEYVESTQIEVKKDTAVQKVDAFGQLMYEKQAVDAFGQKMYKEQKLDEFGTKMYAKIISEPASYHVDSEGDGKCDRCSSEMTKACTHVDQNDDDVCDNEACKAAVPDLHKHEEGSNGICKNCDKLANANNHTEHVDKNGVCKYCKTPIVVEHVHSEPDAVGNCTGCQEHLVCVDGEDEDTLCDGCGVETKPEETDTIEQETETTESEQQQLDVVGVVYRPFIFLSTAVANTEKIVYDETSAPIYDETSAPVYDTTSAPVYEEEVTYVYTGWQTIDGATYYFDKNGNKVTGQQVIDGISYTFSSEGVRSGTIGIDVSKYQSGINWTKVKNAGINFVMIRCGYRGYGSGVLVQDPMFSSHISGAKAAGLRVGIYFFSQAINEAEAVEEASMAVTLARKYGINMPIAIDSEYAAGGAGRADGLSKSERTVITKAFCNTVKNAGYTPMVYASKSWFGSHLDVSQLSGYRIWVAHYAEKCGYTGTYHIWQNTDKGKVDGIPGYVDMNVSSI